MNDQAEISGAVQPIRPDQVTEAKLHQVPDVVLEVFNDLIAERGAGKSVFKVYQDEIVARLEARDLKRRDIFASHWLDVEPIYRDAGWKVTYDKPGYNETGRAYFEFRIT